MTERPTRGASSERRAARRAARRARREALSIRPMPEAVRRHDPLVRAPQGRLAKLGRGLVVAVAAAALHAVLLGAVFGASAVARALSRAKPVVDEPIEVVVVEPTPPAPEPAPLPAVAPEEEKAEEKKPEPKRPEPKKPAEPTAVPPPLDPVDRPKADPTPKENPNPARRVVGLNLESTVEGSGGPSFATGNTRMGETERTAVRPADVAPAEKTVGAPGGAGQGAGENQAASRIPSRGVKVVRATPKDGAQLKPDFPEALRQRGVEADVVVKVSIDASGKVVEVALIAPCEYPELNEAAKAAALRQPWNPETRDGVPSPSTQRYTYQFRVNG